MKRNIVLLAAAIIALGMAACQKEELQTPETNNVNVNTNGPKVKRAADLIGTEWNYTMDDMMFIDEYGDTLPIIMSDLVFGLSFDSSYAHFTFPQDLEAYRVADDGLSLEQIAGIDFEYDYTFATHTGHLLGEAEDEDGNTVPAQLEFTYDDATDAITFILPMGYADDSTSFDMTIIFNRAE